MAQAGGATKKAKCKYWDECYRKDAAHKKHFLHPGDVKGDDKGPEPSGLQLDIDGRKVVFYGDLKGCSRKQAEERAKEYGCVPSGIISHKTDYVVVSDAPGSTCPDATRLGIRVYTQSRWDKLLKNAKRVAGQNDTAPDTPPTSTSTAVATAKPPPLKKKRSAHVHSMSDSDTDTEMASASAATSKKRAANARDLGDDETPAKKKAKDDEPEAAASPKKPTLKRVNTRGKKPKCMYWDKCYRKDPDHKEMYRHPGDPEEAYSDSDEKDDRGKTKATSKPKIYRPRHKAGLQVLLAHKWTEDVNPKGWWLSEKLDGVRAYWDGKTFFSRLGNEFIAPPWFTKGLPSDMELDGELFGGRGKFQSTVSIVKSPEDDRWSQIKYQVFDTPSNGTKPFEKRHEIVKEYFEKNSAKYVKVLDQEKCRDTDHLMSELKRVEAMGGEGVMLREPASKYERRRSKTLLKLKSFHDAEAEVIGYEPSKTAPRLVGSLRCVMECGKEIKVGSGLCDQDRRRPPKIGSIITYRFQEYTNSGSPRFPTFVGVRIDADGPRDVILPKKGD